MRSPHLSSLRLPDHALEKGLISIRWPIIIRRRFLLRKVNETVIHPSHNLCICHDDEGEEEECSYDETLKYKGQKKSQALPFTCIDATRDVLTLKGDQTYKEREIAALYYVSYIEPAHKWFSECTRPRRLSPPCSNYL